MDPELMPEDKMEDEVVIEDMVVLDNDLAVDEFGEVIGELDEELEDDAASDEVDLPIVE